MRNYLSQIASRAAGITETAAIKPNIQSWPVKKNAENRLNPFEEGGDFTEPATPTTSIESTISPFKKTRPFKKEQYPKNDFPAINHNYHEREKSDAPKSDRIFPVRHENLTSLSPETNITLTSSKIRSNTFRTEKPLTEKPFEVKKQVIEKSERIIEEIRASEILESVKPVSIEPNNKHEKTPALKETTSKNNIKPHKKNDRMVSEIRPKAPLNKHPSFVFEKKQKEKRLIIGNLKVEVVQTPKEKNKQIQLPKKEHYASSKLQQDRFGTLSGLKVKFGMGQI